MSQKSAAVNVVVRFQPSSCNWQVNRTIPQKLFLTAAGAVVVPRPLSKNAWEVRDRFLSISKPEQLFRFLNTNGRFTHYANEERWSLEDFDGWRDIIRRLSQVRPENWANLIHEHFQHVDHSRLVSKFQGEFPVTFVKIGSFYVGQIAVHTILQAMIASVYIDWMAGIKMGFCARQDCRKPYEITSLHKRTYCSPECAHHEVVRRSRERKRVARERNLVLRKGLPFWGQKTRK